VGAAVVFQPRNRLFGVALFEGLARAIKPSVVLGRQDTSQEENHSENHPAPSQTATNLREGSIHCFFGSALHVA
jgi:hypothetical protein